MVSNEYAGKIKVTVFFAPVKPSIAESDQDVCREISTDRNLIGK